jgi:hypothetical protein
MSFYVYLHYRLDNNEPFYVGKGSGYRSHSRVGRNQYWHNVVNKYGYRVEIFQTFEDEQEAFDYERDGIAALKEAGYYLTNLTTGGEGTSGHVTTDETKAKISAAHKGKLVTAETKVKLSISLKGKSRSPLTSNHKAKISASLSGIPLSAERKSAISAGSKGKLVKSKYKVIATSLETGKVTIHIGQEDLRLSGFDPSLVYRCCRGKAAQHKGHIFQKEELS